MQFNQYNSYRNKEIQLSDWVVCFISSMHIEHLVFMKHFTVCIDCYVTTTEEIKLFAKKTQSMRKFR